MRVINLTRLARIILEMAMTVSLSINVDDCFSYTVTDGMRADSSGVECRCVSVAVFDKNPGKNDDPTSIDVVNSGMKKDR